LRRVLVTRKRTNSASARAAEENEDVLEAERPIVHNGEPRTCLDDWIEL